MSHLLLLRRVVSFVLYMHTVSAQLVDTSEGQRSLVVLKVSGHYLRPI
jgi:hypothetical protein